MTETFASLVKTASEGQYEGDEDGEKGEEEAQGNGTQRPAEPEAEAQHIGWGYFTVPKLSVERRSGHLLPAADNCLSHISATYAHIDSGRSSLVPYSHLPADSIFNPSIRTSQLPVDPPPSRTSLRPAQLPFGLVDLSSQDQAPFTQSSLHTTPVRVPSPEVTPPANMLPTPPPSNSPRKALPAVTTYSFEETTFARRLSRRAVEKGFHLLSRANDGPMVRTQLADG